MKITPFICLFSILTLSFTTCETGYAQEAGSPSFERYETDLLTTGEKILSTPGESIDPIKPNSTPVTHVNKDSAVARSPVQPLAKAIPVNKPQTEETEESGDDDSVLSFNFLYYLIERYKLQDIVD